jgi:transglutaminase-like putative cysteine protease
VSTPERWRLAIEHRSELAYSEPVRASYNEVRQTPAERAGQSVLATSVTIDPPCPAYRYCDYFGTEVVVFDLAEPHSTLVVHARSLVETEPGPARADGTWEAVAAVGRRSFELLSQSPLTATSAELDEVAHSLRRTSPLETVMATMVFVNQNLAYVPGSTTVRTTAQEAWDKRAGVCQDFAHLTLGLLRCLAIPARYCSGYLHPDSEPEVGLARVGESHAWVECYTGSWWGLDPTSGRPVGLGHVLVATGRDYADVPPLKGIFAGSAGQTSHAEVVLTRVR